MPTVNSHNLDVYYETQGEQGKPAIIFAHGMGGNAAIWFNQVARFMDDYFVVAFDHRYFGRSACKPEQYDPALFPDDVMAIMDAEGIESAVFVCQSMGGWTGSQMAVNHPSRVDGLLMSQTPGIFQHDSAINSRDITQVANRPMSSLESPAVAPDFHIRNKTAALLYTQISAFNSIDPQVIIQGVGRAELGVNTDELTDYEVPTLFVTGNHDSFFAPDYIAALAASIPGASCINFGEVGHSAYYEIPDVFNQAMAEFLNGLQSHRIENH